MRPSKNTQIDHDIGADPVWIETAVIWIRTDWTPYGRMTVIEVWPIGTDVAANESITRITQ